VSAGAKSGAHVIAELFKADCIARNLTARSNPLRQFSILKGHRHDR
jgi:hypothetical protein